MKPSPSTARRSRMVEGDGEEDNRSWIIVMNYDKTYVHSSPFLPIYTARLRPVVMAEHCVCGAGGVVR